MSPRLRDKIWEWPGDEARKSLLEYPFEWVLAENVVNLLGDTVSEVCASPEGDKYFKHCLINTSRWGLGGGGSLSFF